MNSASGGNIIYKFTGDSSGLEKTTKNVNTGFKGLTKSIVGANLVTKGISKAFQIMSQNMGTAVRRFDTMKNFPNVMKNLGIGTAESNEAIKKLEKELQGLPTSLDQGAMAVQRFTSKNGDVKKSTDMFLGLNNALLAGGASSEVQASAMEQISQAYAKGKPDMVEWRSLLSAMPAQAKQLGMAFGMSSEELGEALRKGDISMDDFMAKVMELNEKGADGFESFAVQAKSATGGIQTAMTNLRSRIVQGITAMLEGIEKGLAKANLPSIAEIFDKLGTAIKNAMKAAAPYIVSFVKKLGEVYQWAKKNEGLVKTLAKVVLALVGALSAISVVTKIVSTLAPLIKIFTTLFNVIKTIISVVKVLSVVFKALFALMAANPIVLIIAGIVALVAAFVTLWKKCEAFRNFFINLWNGIKTFFMAVIEGIKTYFVLRWTLIKTTFTTIINAIKSVWTSVWNGIKSIFTTITNAIKNAFTNVVNGIKTKINTIKTFASNIISAFTSLPGKMLNIGKNIATGLWNGIKGLKDWVINKVKSLGKSIIKGLKNVLGIHSPSKEFAIIGRYSVLGYTEALDNMRSDIQEQVQDTFGLDPHLTGSMNNHYSPNVMVNNDINVSTDPLGQTVKKIKTFSGGAKNDYNYGMGV